MKLEPVYVVAPLPPPPMVSRRAFFAGAAGSLVLGVAGGLVLATSSSSGSLPVSDDPIVEWARAASRDPARAPELLKHYHGFLHALSTVPEDPLLWQGFGMIVHEVQRTATADMTPPATVALRQTLRAFAPDLPEAEDWDRILRDLERR